MDTASVCVQASKTRRVSLQSLKCSHKVQINRSMKVSPSGLVLIPIKTILITALHKRKMILSETNIVSKLHKRIELILAAPTLRKEAVKNFKLMQ